MLHFMVCSTLTSLWCGLMSQTEISYYRVVLDPTPTLFTNYNDMSPAAYIFVSIIHLIYWLWERRSFHLKYSTKIFDFAL